MPLMILVNLLNCCSWYNEIGNVNHAVSIVSKRIPYSNFKKDLPLWVEPLNIICSSSEEEKFFRLFLTVFYSVRFINPKSENKRGDEVRIPIHGEEKDREENSIVSMKTWTMNNIYH